jgi:hypothetical protein
MTYSCFRETVCIYKDVDAAGVVRFLNENQPGDKWMVVQDFSGERESQLVACAVEILFESKEEYASH